jgi:hypothetical protein
MVQAELPDLRSQGRSGLLLPERPLRPSRKEIPMGMQALDTVLSFSMIMLLLSMMVTVLVQMVVSVLGLRGRSLIWGTRQLIGSVAPELSDVDAKALADKILSHPSLASTSDKLSPVFRQLGGRRPPISIKPKELLLILEQYLENGELEGEVRDTVQGLFESPAGDGSKLALSLDLLQGLEAGLPEQAQSLRGAAAEALEETKEIVLRMHNWFDASMTEASEHFKLRTRVWTVVFAALFAIPFQIDSVSILTQLWGDPVLRAELVDQAEDASRLYERHGEISKELVALAESDSDTEKQAAVGYQEIEGNIKELQSLLEDIQAQVPDAELEIFEPFWVRPDGGRFPGALGTVLLLSLGAPFWYGALGKLVGFRSAFSEKKEST